MGDQELDSPAFENGAISAKQNGTIATACAEEFVHEDPELEGKKQCCCHMKMIHLLCVIIVFVWGLLALPIVFYHLPEPQKSSNSTIISSNASSSACLLAFPYPTTGGVCQTALANILLSMSCDSGGTTLVLRDEESTASALIPTLNFLNPSTACREAVVPFLCVYLFGLCDSSGVSIHPTSGRCEEIRDRVCMREWQDALRFGAALPDCKTFPTEQASCPVQNRSGLSGSGSGYNLPVPMNSTSTQLPCSEGFYREDPSSICVPSCFSWLQYSKAVSISIDVMVFLTAFLGFGAAVAVIVVSFLRRKRMFVFPSVIVVYQTIDILVLAFFVLVNYMDRSSLFCTSMNLFQSQLTVTPFCVISGMVFMYTLVQLAVWWLFHTTTLFWKIRFPFHSRSFEASHKIKYIHIGCVIAGVVLPLVPILTSMADFAVDLKSNPSRNVSSFISGGLGYGQTRFPPILCTGSDRNAVYYSVVLPIDMILAVGCSLLVIIFWIVHKQHGLFKAKQSKNPFKIGAAERKLLIIFCYYVVLAAIALTSFTISTRNLPRIVIALVNYFNCEQNGYNPARPCSRSEFEKLNHPVLSALSYVLLGLFPVINLVYAVNIQELKEYCHCLRKKTKVSFISDNPSTGSSAVNSSTMKGTFRGV